MDAFADHWGFERRPYEEWARRHVESTLTDRSLQTGFGWVDVLGVDGESATGTFELYERAGMHIAKREDTFERTLGAVAEF